MAVNVDHVREDLKKYLNQYQKIRDCLDGSDAIKAKGTTYLPMPGGDNRDPDNVLRYEDYKARAVFYNVTKRTSNGLVGQIMARDPVIEVPSLLEPMLKDVTGSGITLEQFAEVSVGYCVDHGRGGILTDYPVTEGGASRADLLSGNVRPTLSVYEPWNIINWRTKRKGAKTVLSLVVLVEKYDVEDDGFESVEEDQFRVLKLDENDRYIVEVYRKSGASGITLHESYQPKDGRGNFLPELPFTFFGAKNNDPRPDAPPLFDLADLNIGHYRNSADYEESCFIIGQPTLTISGLTQEWIKNIFEDKPIRLGARAAVPLPADGEANIIQAEPNTLAFEAMQHKERQMVALGAKLVEQAKVQRTATEASMEEASENSVLAMCAKNVSSAITFALEWAAIFVGAVGIEADARSKAVKFELNNEFDIAKLTPQEQQQRIAHWQAGAITFEEMREGLRKSGIATLTDEKARDKIDAEMAAQAASVDLTGDNDDV